MQLSERIGHSWQEGSINRRSQLAETETPIKRIAKRFLRKAIAIEKRFRDLHGQSSIGHLAEVMKFTNKIIPECECCSCLKARFVPPKSRRLEQYTRNEN